MHLQGPLECCPSAEPMHTKYQYSLQDVAWHLGIKPRQHLNGALVGGSALSRA